jgi:hypothetical protein
MQTLEELNAHYKAVRARLTYAPPPPPKKVEPVVESPIPEPKFEPVVKPEKLTFSPAQMIIEEVAELTGIPSKEIKGHRRQLAYIRARQQAAYEIRLRLKLSLPMIGRVLGKRDHTTILHAIRRHAARNNLPMLILSKDVGAHTAPIEKELSHESHHL